jgi:hypothetical protein
MTPGWSFHGSKRETCVTSSPPGQRPQPFDRLPALGGLVVGYRAFAYVYALEHVPSPR